MQSLLTSNYESSVRPTLDMIENLRNVGIESFIPIPQVVVVGDQSTGKSSILEGMSGISFPRGEGLVTRCATQINMKRVENETWKAKVKVRRNNVLTDYDDGYLTNPADIEASIRNITDEITTDSGFSKDSIVIDVISASVPDLTIIDLPGIIRTTTGNQTKQMMNDVRQLVDDYLKQEQTVILAVVPATCDVATVGILEDAMLHDPEGLRTIGVITKPDWLQAGYESSVLAVLQNKTKPLKLGYVMVRNPGASDAETAWTYQEARQNETEYFRNHPVWKRAGEELLGSANLTKKLTKILVHRIQCQLPIISKELEDQILSTKQNLENLGLAPPVTVHEKRKELTDIITKFCTALGDSVKGSYSTNPIKTNKRLRIRAIFRQEADSLKIHITELIPEFDGKESLDELIVKMEEYRGTALPGFLNFELFSLLFSDVVDSWTQHAFEFLSNMHSVCKQVIYELLEHHCHRYKVLHKYMEKHSFQVIERLFSSGHVAIGKAIKREKEELYTSNHYYMDTLNKLRCDRYTTGISELLEAQYTIFNTNLRETTKEAIVTPHPQLVKLLSTWYSSNIGNSSNAKQEAEDMAAVLQAYWKTSSKRFLDSIPQIVSSELLSSLEDDISSVLHQNIHDIVDDSFNVSEEESVKRQVLTQNLAKLVEASRIIRD